ncbi:uncharacterized protein [Antedon mediterranea]|uniref:uncharacterized protein n=1 Tax=Antedon mediterranea TaxID=105859 RepID=UPI003AF9C804
MKEKRCYTGIIIVAIFLLPVSVLTFNQEEYEQCCRIFDLDFPTNESSTRNEYLKASPAFDNNTGPNPGDPDKAVCSHTTDENAEPWWYVNLLDIYEIEYIVLYNRETHSERLEGAQVRVGTSTDNLKNNTACGSPVSSQDASKSAGVLVLKCEHGTQGNIVSVQLEDRTDFLTLCEVKIYAAMEIMEYTTVEMTVSTSPSHECEIDSDCGTNEFCRPGNFSCVCDAGYDHVSQYGCVAFFPFTKQIRVVEINGSVENAQWKPELEDKTSTTYHKYAENMCSIILFAYEPILMNSTTDYNCSINEFSKGSIIVNFSIFFFASSTEIGNNVLETLYNATFCNDTLPSEYGFLKIDSSWKSIDDLLNTELVPGQIKRFRIGELSGFVARLFRNNTLPEQVVAKDRDDTARVGLNVDHEDNKTLCIALFGKPTDYNELKQSAKDSGLDGNTNSTVEVVSNIFQSFIFDSTKTKIESGIEIMFKFPTKRFRDKKDNETAVCGFFNESLKSWSTNGCETDDSDKNEVKCKCNHTTSYAILFQTSEPTISDEDQKRLSIITYIGLLISTIFLIVALVTQNILPDLRKSMRFKILTNLIIAAILSNVVFMTLQLAKKQEIVCAIYAGILHYSLLVVFVWMMIFSADLYAKVFYSFANHHKRMKWSRFVGWGLPLIVVLVTAAVTQEDYVLDEECWLNYKEKAIWGFVGPVVAVVLVNIALISRVLFEVSKKSRSANVTKKRQVDDIKYVALRATLLLPVIGVTWVTGYLVLFFDDIWLKYVFVIANSCQGVFIWLTQFFWSREVKNAWTSMKKKRGFKVSLKKSENKEFNNIGEGVASPPNSTIENTYSLSSKKSLTQTSEIPLQLTGSKLKN